VLISLHSELNTHSGLHPGGLPWYDGRHEQIAWPFISLHWLFGPHGDGVQGVFGSDWITKIKQQFIFLMITIEVMKVLITI